MGSHAHAQLIFGVRVPDELDRDTYETANFELRGKLMDCEISPDFDVIFGGGSDWDLDDMGCYLVVKEIASSYGEGGVEVPYEDITDAKDSDIVPVQKFCNEHGIPIKLGWYLVESYG